MGDSFDARVKRLFGSRLFDTVPGNSFPTASWTVAAGEVERHRWNREDPTAVDREADPCAFAFDEGGCFAKSVRNARRGRRGRNFEDDLDDLDDDDDEEGREGGDGEDDGRGDDGDREEREIRISIGLDPALDYEEEEDEFDRTALNRDNTGDRVYMRDVKDHGHHLHFHAVVPDFADDPSEEIHDFSRDPRADHFAANARLKEDKKLVQSGHASPVHINEENTQDMHTTIAEDAINLKPILKRKQSQIDPEQKKRVRFDTGCDDSNSKSHEEQRDSHMVPLVASTMVGGETSSQMNEVSPNIPDYLRNPSKYTCYTLDWSVEDDNETNKKAFLDFKNLVKRSEPDETTLEIPLELPKSITFTPRKKKSHDAMSIDSGSANTHEESSKEHDVMVCTTGIAAGYLPECDAHEMEEDETCVAEVSINARKSDRRYRSKSSSGDP